jgi:AraC-like DNA-binding protein
MPSSMTSVFGEPDDFQAALQNEGTLGLYIADCGRFIARLTQVGLHRLRLAAVAEQLPRIGFLGVPPDVVLVSFPSGDRPSPIWGGIQPQHGEMMTFGPDHRVHVRTQGPCRWGAIWVPAQILAEGFYELMGNKLTITPAAGLWRPSRTPGSRLLRLHAAAIRAAEVRPETIVDAEAAHGMEQQLFHALVECLSAKPAEDQMKIRHREQGLAARFEDLLQTQQDPALSMDEVCSALGVSARLLQRGCAEDLGMSLASYIRLRALHRVHDILRGGAPGVTSVSQVARRHGFIAPGHFAAIYRALFGELPSITLRRQHPVVALCPRRSLHSLA